MELYNLHKRVRQQFDVALGNANDADKINAIEKLNRLEVPRSCVHTTDRIGEGEFGVVELGVLSRPNGDVEASREASI